MTILLWLGFFVNLAEVFMTEASEPFWLNQRIHERGAKTWTASAVLRWNGSGRC
jgi:hypothetical protein